MGVFAPLVGIIGTMQAAEALKLLAGIGSSLAGRLQMLDARTMGWNEIRMRARATAGVRRPALRSTRARVFSAPWTRTRTDARNFPTAGEDAEAVVPASRYAGPESAYRLAFTDTEFLLREELRPVRMQLELLKPEMVQRHGIRSTIVIFGSARIVPPPGLRAPGRGGAPAATRGDPRAEMAVAMSRYDDEAPLRRHRDEEVARAGDAGVRGHRRRPGIMEAGNRGAHEVGGRASA